DSYTFTAAIGEGIQLRVADLARGVLYPWLTVYGPTGNLVSSTANPDVAMRWFSAPASGTYTVVVSDTSGGNAGTGDYKLYFTRSPGANAGGALSPGGSVADHIDLGELDSYTFTAAIGEGIQLRVADLARGVLYPWLTVYGPTGNLVSPTANPDVAMAWFSAPASGTYTVVVSDTSGGNAGTGDYKLYFTRSPGA